MLIQCTCEECGTTFPENPARVRSGRGRFCSRACRYAPRPGVMGNAGTVFVLLTQGKSAVIDIEDAERILAYTWRLSDRYAARKRRQADGPGATSIFMHRVTANTPLDMDTDHINGNPLDNRRSNLRWATPSQNMANNRVRRQAASGYRGVYWHKGTQKWTAIVCHRYIGLFETAEEAARAYDAAARNHLGEFARLNFPD